MPKPRKDGYDTRPVVPPAKPSHEAGLFRSSRSVSRSPVSPNRPGRPTEQEARYKRNTILQVATRLFLLKGYRTVTTRAVAAQSNVSTRTLFNMFKDKATLFRACLEYLSQITPSSIEESDGNAVASLVRLGIRLVEELCQPERIGFHKLVMVDGDIFPEIARAAEMDHNALHLEPLARVLESMGLEQPGCRTNSRIFTSMAISEWSRALAFGYPMPTAEQTTEHVERVCEIFIRGLGRQEGSADSLPT